MFICQELCTGIQGIYTLFIGGVHLPKYVCLPSIVYWYSRHLCSFNWGVHQPKYVHLPILVYWYSRHLCLITQGVHLPKYVHLPSFVYWNSRHLCSINGGWGPLAKVGFSAKFGVVVFKASILNSMGGPLGKVGSSANPLNYEITETYNRINMKCL